MPNIQQLEEELRQTKQIVQTLSSNLEHMEQELAVIKGQQPATGQRNLSATGSFVQPTPMYGAPVAPQNKPQGQQPMYGAPVAPHIQPQGQQPMYGAPAAPQIQPQGQQPMYGTSQPQGQPYMQPKPPVAPQTAKVPAKTTGKNTEAVLGKTIMGIVASVLIFISFILFATLLIPLLTDAIKVFMMFAVSFGITAVGLVMWFRNKRENTFFLSLTACGVGAIYISLFLCNVYFHLINDILLYILILVWAVGVLWLSRYQQRLFEAIGEAGIFISVMFGSFVCVSHGDNVMLLVLTGYTVIGIAAYLLIRMDDAVSLMMHTIFGAVDMLCLIVSANTIADGVKNANFYIILSVLLACSLAIMVLILAKVDEENAYYLPIVGMVYQLLSYIALFSLLGKENVTFVAALLFTVVVYCVLEILMKKVYAKRMDEKRFRDMFAVWQGILLLASIAFMTEISFLSKYLSGAILAIPLLLYGYRTKDKKSQVFGLISYVLLCLDVWTNVFAHCAWTVLVFILICLCLYLSETEYKTNVKNVAYIAFFVGLTLSVFMMRGELNLDGDTTAVLLLWVLGIINIAAKLTPFGKNWVTKEEEGSFTVVSNVVNGYLMVYALAAIGMTDDVQRFFAILAALALFSVNTVSILKKKDNGLSVYVGIKYTVLTLVILGSYDAPNYVLSISSFIIAIVCVVFGFLMNIKSLRIYGLVLSLICVIKLVMIDITYSNTAGHALSFFISGVLCFVISAVYTVAEKNMKDKGDIL